MDQQRNLKKIMSKDLKWKSHVGTNPKQAITILGFVSRNFPNVSEHVLLSYDPTLNWQSNSGPFTQKGYINKMEWILHQSAQPSSLHIAVVCWSGHLNLRFRLHSAGVSSPDQLILFFILLSYFHQAAQHQSPPHFVVVF